MIKTEYGNELKKSLLKGVVKLNNAVSSTLGPSGRTVVIDGDAEMRITKDGVSVAKSFDKLEDPVENVGAQLVKQVASKAADKAGDGTTTATLLASEMIKEGFKVIDRGVNPAEVKKGIDKAVKAAVNYLKDVISEPVSNEEQILQVATISGNNDDEVGKLISTALQEVGNDGIVAIEEGKSAETTLEIVEGMMFNRGYKSPYFVTDNGLMNVVLKEPKIFLYDGRLSSDKQIQQILQAAFIGGENPAVLLIAEDIDGVALAMLLLNKVQGGRNLCAVKAPDFGDRRTAILEDLAVLTGGTVVSEKKQGKRLDQMTPAEIQQYFGQSRIATITTKDTTIIDPKGEIEAIEKRMNEIKTQIDHAKSPFEKETLQERLGKMAGGVAIISVGGFSEVELKEKKDRIDDALHATKAAIEQGIVPGGGMALVHCSEKLSSVVTDNNDQKLGVEIVKKALLSPFKTILKNAGIEDSFKILNDVKDNILKNSVPQREVWEGFNVKTGQYENFFVSGVIDPTKVTRTALENAASVAGVFLTTDALVYKLPETNNNSAVGMDLNYDM